MEEQIFKKGEKVRDDIYGYVGTVVEVVERDSEYRYKYFYYVEWEKMGWFKMKKWVERCTAHRLNKIIE